MFFEGKLRLDFFMLLTDLVRDVDDISGFVLDPEILAEILVHMVFHLIEETVDNFFLLTGQVA